MTKEFETLIESSDWVFFDFFGTLVHRNISEKELIEAWAYNLASKIEYKISAKELVDYRIKSVQEIYRSGNKEEYSYNDIIKRMYNICHKQLLNLSYGEFCQISKTVEIEVELSVQKVREDVLELVHCARNNGKQIGIISDFYLGKKELELFLNDKNIDPSIFTCIFVSSEFGAKKNSGNLYKIVRSTIENKKRCVMVGDNPGADIKMSEMNGFKSYHVPDIIEKGHTSNSKIAKLGKEYSKKPFANYAFGLYYFIEQIYINAVKCGYKKLVFLSREGYILKKMFDIYQADRNVKIKTIYLYVSRLSTFLPSLKSLNEEDFDVIFKQYGDISLKAFLKNLQFNDNVIETISNQEDINKDEIITDFKHSQQFHKVKRNNLFLHTYEVQVAQEKEKLKGYIDQVVGKDNTITIVDIGWKGTMQDNLYRLWSGDKTFIGLYYGIFNQSGNECNKNIKKGLVFDKYPERTPNYYIWEFETHLIEQLLAAPHGSTIGYERRDDKIEPILLQTEDDIKLYRMVEAYQKDLITLFKEIVTVFKNSAENSNDYYKQITRIQLKCELFITDKMISFENEALSEKTNNFGWFSQVPLSVKKNKREAVKKFLKELRCIHYQDGGISFLKYLSYISIKMNAREKYRWKKFVYRMVYLPEYLLVKG